MSTAPDRASGLLRQLENGDGAAAKALFPLVYDELRAQAHRQRYGWHGDRTMNSTAIVHEAYLKLIGQGESVAWSSRAHFLCVAARAMRQVLIDYAKGRRRQKRGGHVKKISFDNLVAALDAAGGPSEEREEVLMSLHEALERLEKISERQSRIVECRFFGGMTIEETAAALGLSPATVKRCWEMARVWLLRELVGKDA
jgi:RNA polymerase sigma factor (TIGR02999 family)